MKRFAALILALLVTSPCFAGMGRNILKSAASQTTYIRIVDDETGLPITTVTSATSGLDLEYVRLGAAPVDITESDLAATSSAYSSGGIKHVGGGVYRVDLPDAAVLTGVDQVSVQGTCTDMVVLGVTHQLVDLSLSGTSAADLKDFADAGYNPSTNFIVGIDGTINTFDELSDGATDFAAAMDAQGYTQANAAALADLLNGGRLDLIFDATKAKTDFLPSATAGASGGLTIAGSNAATTFSSLTSTGAFSINGTSMVAQTGDSYARIGANGASLSSLATASALSTVSTNVTTINTKIGTPADTIAEDIANVEGGGGGGGGLTAAETRAALGMSSANLDTQLGTLATAAALSTVGGNASTAATEAAAANTKIGTPTGASISADNAAIKAAVEAVEITPTVEIVGGGPFEQDLPSANNIIKLGTLRDGTVGFDRPVRIKAGWSGRKWGLDCTSQLANGATLRSMSAPALTDNGDLSVGTTEGTYGIHDAIAMFTVTAQSDATGTAHVRLVIVPQVGEEITVDVPVKVIQ